MLFIIADVTLSEFGKYALMTLDEWTSILHLASKWGFESIQSLALKELLPLASPVDKIVLGRKYGFDDWLIPAFVAVCARAEPLSLAEAKRMDGEDVARIYQAREKVRGSSIAIATEVAEAAVGCIFGNYKAATGFTPADMNTPACDTSSTAKVVNLRPESSNAVKTLAETPATSLPADDDKVDDGLMEALATWSRICSQFNDSNFHHLPTGHYAQRGYYLHPQYVEYQVDYESILTYLGSSQLQPTSVCRFLSVVLQSDLNTKRGTFCTHLYADLHDRMSKVALGSVGLGAHAPVGKTEFTRMVNELCPELVDYECTRQDARDPFNYRLKPTRLVINLSDAGLLTGTTWSACLGHLIPLSARPEPYLL
jgi:hypothetical protein